MSFSERSQKIDESVVIRLLLIEAFVRYSYDVFSAVFKEVYSDVPTSDLSGEKLPMEAAKKDKIQADRMEQLVNRLDEFWLSLDDEENEKAVVKLLLA